jgi:hypothetical protein
LRFVFSVEDDFPTNIIGRVLNDARKKLGIVDTPPTEPQVDKKTQGNDILYNHEEDHYAEDEYYDYGDYEDEYEDEDEDESGEEGDGNEGSPQYHDDDV